MQLNEVVVGWIAAAVPFWPLLAFLGLGLVALAHRTPGERTVAGCVQGALGLSFLGSVLTALFMMSHHQDVLMVDVAPWFSTGTYTFEVSFLVDKLSVTMMVLSSAISLLIGRYF